MAQFYTLVGYPDLDEHGRYTGDAPTTKIRADCHSQHIWSETSITVSRRVAARVKRVLRTAEPRVWIGDRLIRCSLVARDCEQLRDLERE